MAVGACGDDDAPADPDATVNNPDGAVTIDATPSDPDAGVPKPVTVSSILSGSFRELPAYSGQGLSGRAMLVRRTDGTTTVQIQAVGVTASTTFPAHVHALPCGFNAAGGHYKIDPSIATAMLANEIWPEVTSDANGIGFGAVTVSHDARGDALSVVIHDPNAANAKMMCANLRADDQADVVATGTFAPFADQVTLDATIAGSATLIRRENSTTVSVAVTGLTSTETYSSHVHAMTCGVMDAAGHYKLDPTVGGTVDTNELWPDLSTVAGDGTASDTFDELGHSGRADAQSIVIHRAGVGKVACANLVRATNPVLDTEGGSTLLADAISRGFTSLSGSAMMTRDFTETTWATLQVSGLTAAADYGAHVHNQPCSEGNGGGHYKIDTAVSGAVETNEIWLNFTADADGNGSVSNSADHLARPEAQSIVLHDTDGARLACIDLD
jgi:hypothetical protein